MALQGTAHKVSLYKPDWPQVSQTGNLQRTVNMELVVGLLLVAGMAQATPAIGYRSRRQIEAKCECREKIDELDRSIGNCTTDREDFFVTTGNGKVVLKDKVGSNYFCTVDGDSNFEIFVILYLKHKTFIT